MVGERGSGNFEGMIDLSAEVEAGYSKLIRDEFLFGVRGEVLRLQRSNEFFPTTQPSASL